MLFPYVLYVRLHLNLDLNIKIKKAGQHVMRILVSLNPLLKQIFRKFEESNFLRIHPTGGLL
jgi:hypothetical protein